jgi:hypothetical protein
MYVPAVEDGGPPAKKGTSLEKYGKKYRQGLPSPQDVIQLPLESRLNDLQADGSICIVIEDSSGF